MRYSLHFWVLFAAQVPFVVVYGSVFPVQGRWDVLGFEGWVLPSPVSNWHHPSFSPSRVDFTGRQITTSFVWTHLTIWPGRFLFIPPPWLFLYGPILFFQSVRWSPHLLTWLFPAALWSCQGTNSVWTHLFCFEGSSLFHSSKQLFLHLFFYFRL